MKSFTDLEQSKKLAEILPLESADCFWDYDEIQKFHRISWFEDGYNKESQLMLNENNVCAWSLTALLDYIKQPLKRLEIAVRTDKNYNVFALIDNLRINLTDENNLVDAFYKMIIELKEKNLI